MDKFVTGSHSLAWSNQPCSRDIPWACWGIQITFIPCTGQIPVSHHHLTLKSIMTFLFSILLAKFGSESRHHQSLSIPKLHILMWLILLTSSFIHDADSICVSTLYVECVRQQISMWQLNKITDKDLRCCVEASMGCHCFHFTICEFLLLSWISKSRDSSIYIKPYIYVFVETLSL